jgi:hypothetical protein
MSGTALDHQLIRDYLRELDAALRGLPAAQAAELREQIAAHLDEALPPDAADQEVAETLSRLGSPADLAAEAAAANPAAAPATTVPTTTVPTTTVPTTTVPTTTVPTTTVPTTTVPATTVPAATEPSATETAAAPTARGFLTSVRLRTWVAVVVVVLLAAAGARVADVFLSATPLQFTMGADWWYRQDAAREVIATADNVTQNTAPIRPGQRQGYVVSIYNPTKLTQTITGDASGPRRGWDNPGGPREQIAVSRSYTDIANGFAGQNAARHITFGLPVSIPPFQTRLVRVLWTSDVCLTKGESDGIDQLYLRVRVGWFTRTEVVPQQGWYLIGPHHRRCH